MRPLTMKLPAAACYTLPSCSDSLISKSTVFIDTLPRQDNGFLHKTHNIKNEDITRGLAVNPVKRIHFIGSVEMSSMTVPNQPFVDRLSASSNYIQRQCVRANKDTDINTYTAFFCLQIELNLSHLGFSSELYKLASTAKFENGF